MPINGIDLSTIREIDLGCGNSGGRLIGLQEKGRHTIGIDLDIGPSNPFDVMAEVSLRVISSIDMGELQTKSQKDTLAILRQTSCYYHYPKDWDTGDGKTQLDINNFLLQQLPQSGEDLTEYGRHIEQDKTGARDELLFVNKMIRQSGKSVEIKTKLPRFPPGIQERIIGADVLSILGALEDGKIERIYADYFLNNLPSELTEHILEVCSKKLRRGGFLEIVGDIRCPVREDFGRLGVHGLFHDTADTPKTRGVDFKLTPRIDALILIDTLVNPNFSPDGLRIIYKKEE